jgi:hypothetical protein
VLAELGAAEAQAKAGDVEAAKATLARLAGSDQAAPIYQSLGELLMAQRQVADAQAPTALAELEPLTGVDSPWRHSALELRALAQMRSGDTVAARQTLDELLADPQTPPDLARRAAEVLAFLGGSPAADADPEGAVTEAE